MIEAGKGREREVEGMAKNDRGMDYISQWLLLSPMGPLAHGARIAFHSWGGSAMINRLCIVLCH